MKAPSARLVGTPFFVDNFERALFYRDSNRYLVSQKIGDQLKLAGGNFWRSRKLVSSWVSNRRPLGGFEPRDWLVLLRGKTTYPPT